MKYFKFSDNDSQLYFNMTSAETITQGPVVQSVVSLTSSLVVKMLPVLVSTISNL